MLNKQSTVDYLRKSLLLKDPTIETDEAYKFTDEDLWEIIQLVIPNHNPSYTVDNYPDNETYFAILLAKKEIYYRLATSSAPFYPLEAEGASLRKDYRFKHYMTLIRRVEIEYEQMWDKFERNIPIKIGDIIIKSKHFTERNYNLADKPQIELTVDNIRDTSIDISWTKFDASKGMFSRYVVFVSTSPIYDEYEDEISSEANKIALITDIHRTKFRIKDLNPNSTYHIAVVTEDLNKLQGFSEKEATTLV